jgi:mannose-6-phosphate isomerase-like protein (cupin superfamily)
MANKTFQIFSSTIEILVPSSASNNTLCVFVETAPPGGGPPPHKHMREDEVFRVLEGEFEFFDGQSWVSFFEGETLFSGRGSFHGFRNAGKTPGRMLLMTNGGGIDEYFENISNLKLPQDLERLEEISAFYGLYFAPQK